MFNKFKTTTLAAVTAAATLLGSGQAWALDGSNEEDNYINYNFGQSLGPNCKVNMTFDTGAPYSYSRLQVDLFVNGSGSYFAGGSFRNAFSGALDTGPALTASIITSSCGLTDVSNFVSDGLSPNYVTDDYYGLLDNDEGNKYQIQCLPDSNYENMVIPVGVIAAANKEITFTTETQNLPDGINVYIEDREKNTFTQLNKTNSNYTIKINEKLNGIGRFYLHTKNNILSTSDIALHNLSVYKLDESHLRVVGLPQGKSSIKLFTVLGKQILNSTFISNGIHNVSIPKLTAGIYFVKLQSEKGSIKKKILIK